MNLRSVAASASIANTFSRSNNHTEFLFAPPVKEEEDEEIVDDDEVVVVVVAAVNAKDSSSSKLPPIPAMAVRDWLKRVGVHRGNVLLIAAVRERRVSIDMVDQDTP